MTQHILKNNINAPQVTIVVNEHCAYVHAAGADLIAPILQRQVNCFTAGGSTGVKHRKQVKKHYARDRQGLLFFSGLVPRVQRALEQQGIAVEVDNQTQCKWLLDAQKAAQQLTDLSREDKRVLAAICDSPHGQLVVQGTCNIARHIAILAEVFDKRTLLIVTKNKACAARLHQQVSEYTDRRIALYHQLPWVMGIDPWAIIGTGQLFGVCDLEPWQVIIFVDVESLLAASTMNQLHTRRDFLCYCFVSPNSRLGDSEQFQIEELVGPVIYRQPRNGPEPADVDVVLVKTPPLPKFEGDCCLAKKRTLIWQNDDRNKLISTLAKGIQRGHSKKLIENGLLNKAQSRAIFADSRYPSVAILVENVEHGEQLHRLLSHWDLRTGHEMVSFIPTVSGREITTMVYAEEYGIGVDVLIRADGDIGWPLSNQVFPRKSLSPDKVVVVDLIDTGSKRAKRTAQPQRRGYRDRGWQLID